jgi:hypothetical protein
MNIKQLPHIIKFWLWSAMHSPYFPLFEIRINGIIQARFECYASRMGGEIAGLHVYLQHPSIQIYVHWKAECAFIDCYPQYKNADWLSLNAPF